jgi:hypothetical protein
MRSGRLGDARRQGVPLAVDGEDRQAEAAAEVELLERPADQARLGHQQGLGDSGHFARQVLRALPVEVRADLDPRRVLDLEEPLPARLDDQQVPSWSCT